MKVVQSNERPTRTTSPTEDTDDLLVANSPFSVNSR